MIGVSTDDFNKAVTFLEQLGEYGNSSLSGFTKPALIESPVYIEDSIAEETVLPNIITSLYNIYIGYILTALQFNTVVTGNKTIRDLTSIVSTKNYINSRSEEELYIGIEDLIKSFSISPSKEALTPGGKNASGYINGPKDISLPSGRILEVDFTNDENNNSVYKIKFFVKLNPRFINTDVVQYVISANFKQPFMRRLLQLQSGEIKFFKDFIFQIDRAEKRSKALKNDKSNAISDIFSNQRKSFIKRIFKTLKMNSSQNIFNSIFIFDKMNFLDKCRTNGLNFNDIIQRQKFFNSTTSLFIVLVDPRYSLVSIYINSIADVGEYSYNAFKNVSSKDNMSVADIMDIFQKNQIPKF